MAKLTTLKPRVGQCQGRDLQQVNPDSWRAGKTTGERGYNYRWQKARATYLERNPLCRHCQDKGIVTVATDVDHITPHRGSQALFWDKTNWQPLCHSCHSVKTQAEEVGGEA